MKNKLKLNKFCIVTFFEFIKYQKLVGPDAHNPIFFNVKHKTQDEVEKIPFPVKPDDNIITRIHGNIRNSAFMLCFLS